MTRKALFVMIVVLSTALMGCAGWFSNVEGAPDEEIEIGNEAQDSHENAGESIEMEEGEVAVDEMPPPAIATGASAPESESVEEAIEAPRDMGGGGGGGEDEAGGLGGGPVEEPITRGDDADVPERGAESLSEEPSESEVDETWQGGSSLQAGATDDNENFEAYLQYRHDYLDFVGESTVHDVNISERHVIRVNTPNGQPVLGARVSVYTGQTLVAEMRTPATGIVYFFPLADAESADEGSFVVTVDKDAEEANFTLERGDPRGDEWIIELDVLSAQPPVNLDVLFLFDTTQSMADEFQDLQQDITSISSRVDALPARPDARFGLVAYRDRGDEYVTQVYDFTPDVVAFQEDLMDERAVGGNDLPESLNEALHDAIWEPEWRVENTVSLIILVADAPPHLDYADDDDYAVEMVEAARRGIKIHAIAAPGLDDTGRYGEYVFRQMAQYTGGYYIAIEEGGSAEEGAPHTVPEGSYTVEDLDDLVVRLIEEELANLTQSEQQ